jgi:hypothetical protein
VASTGVPAESSARGRGRFIALVGPDGVGKTTVAVAICEVRDQPTAYFHFYPPLRGSLPPGPPETSMPNPVKGQRRGSMTLGLLRIGRNYVRFWLGYLLRVRPALRLGTVVVADRWAYGYIVQPHALKFFGPDWVARLVVASLPAPDLVANLTAPSAVIHARKQELTEDQIQAELRAWAAIPAVSLTAFDSEAQPGEIADHILEAAWS